MLAKLKKQSRGITVNGCHSIATDRLNAGDCVCLELPADENTLQPVNIPVSVLYEDQDVLVVNKPSGMPMYPTPGHDCDSLANAIAYRCASKQDSFAFRPIYRLDKDTTGIVVLAKHAYAASLLAGNVKKTYVAVCEGTLAGSGVINQPIGVRDGHTIQREVRADGECAETQWRSLLVGTHYTFLALHLKTGRTHQIRVHFSSCGHPLAGDDFYGGKVSVIARQALHCGEVRFIHPVTKRGVRFVQALPADMRNIVCLI